MKRIISILLENESGALSRVVGLFAQRGYNIDTLTVAPTDDDTLSRLTLTTQGDDHMAEQIVKQLHKLNKDFCTFWSSLKKPPWRREPGGLSPTCLATSQSSSPGDRTDTSGATHPLVVC